MQGPTWVVFAVSGLVVWLIDNWPPCKSICFLLIFIPAGDISTVPCFPGPSEPRSRSAVLGLGNLTSPNLKDSWAGKKTRTGTQELEGFLGPREGTTQTGSLAPHFSHSAAAPSGCGSNKGPAGRGQPHPPHSPGASGTAWEAGVEGREWSVSSKGLVWPPPDVQWWRHPVVRRSPKEPPPPQGEWWPCAQGVGRGPPPQHTHTPIQQETKSSHSSHQKALHGPFSQPMPDPLRVWGQ